MEYRTVTNDAKRAVIRARIEQAEMEHYGTQVTKDLADALVETSTDETTKDQYQQQAMAAGRRLGELEAQILEYRTLYDAIPVAPE